MKRVFFNTVLALLAAMLSVLPLRAQVVFNTTNFPDANFRQYLMDNFPDKGFTALDDTISSDNINTITSINCQSKNISNLKGIEYFTNLNYLNCSRNRLSSLNLSGCTALKNLYCNNNSLSTLNVSNCAALTTLHCYSNYLNSLDVSNLTSLTSLYCYSNQLTSLDVSNLSKLNYLYCNNNQLTSLDVSRNSSLLSLYCYQNKLETLSTGPNEKIQDLFCYNNQLTSLDLSLYLVLRRVNCSNNKLKALSVDYNGQLTELNCSNNQLTVLYLTHNSSLQNLNCSTNQLSTLDISPNTNLKNFDCSNNQLTDLSLASNRLLTSLTCSGNQLTTLDVSKNTSLNSLTCSNNQISLLDLSSNTLLNSLDCSNNLLETIAAKTVTTLNCSGNKITEVDFSGNTTINTIDISNNRISPTQMQLLVESLRTNTSTNSVFRVMSNTTELNVMTTSQVELAQSKGWTPLCGNNNTWTAYLGSDEALPINETNFPDPAFREYLKSLTVTLADGTTITPGSDSMLNATELYSITTINVPNNASNLNGIHLLSHVNTINCVGSSLEALELQSLYNFKKLNTSDCDNLSTVKLTGTQLERVSLNNCPALEEIVFGKSVSQVIINDCESLETLSISDKGVTSLQVSACPSLLTIDCSKNKLTALDITDHTSLITLNCSQNQIESLNVGSNRNLQTLNCSGNLLTTLDVAQNSLLRQLNCSQNNLETLDVGSNPLLTELKCNNNRLSTIDVTKLAKLAYFDFSYNILTSVDLSQNVALTDLICELNQLTVLDLTRNTELVRIICRNNASLTSIVGLPKNVSVLTVNGCSSLASLDCSNRKLRALNLSNCSSLVNVNCANNQISTLILENCSALKVLDCHGNALSSITNIAGLELDYLDCSANGISGLPRMSVKVLKCSTQSNSFSVYSINNNIDKNRLEELDVSNNVFGGSGNVVTIEGFPKLSRFEIRGCRFLSSIRCNSERLSYLDISDNYAIKSLSIQGSNFSTLGIDTLINLLPEVPSAQLYVDDNVKMTSSQVLAAKNKGWTVNSVYGDEFQDVDTGIAINEANFPDVKFRTYLLNQPYGQDALLQNSEIRATTSLNLSNQDITNLKGLEYFKNLRNLDCSGNDRLETIDCSNFALTELNIEGCASLKALSTYGNKLSETAMNSIISQLPTVDTGEYLVCRDGNTVLVTAQADVVRAKGWTPKYYDNQTGQWLPYDGVEDAALEINESNFPDEAFRNYLLAQDYGQDGIISAFERFNLKYLNVRSKGISSLSGIEHFTELEYLVCLNNKLSSLDLSAHSKLLHLDIGYNQFSSLDNIAVLNQLQSLRNLRCNNNQLTAIDISQLAALDTLYCPYNQLTTLALQSNSLKDLRCGYNLMTSLDISQLTALEVLYCRNINLTTFAPQNNTLKYLDCQYNKMTSLDISQLTALENLYCNNNNLATFAPQNNTLKYLDCSTNGMSQLDASKCPKLETLQFYSGNPSLERLNVTGCTELKYLFCSHNSKYQAGTVTTGTSGKLERLDLSTNVKLIEVDCSGHLLSELDVRNCKDLKVLWCNANRLKKLRVDNCTNLSVLFAWVNELERVDLSGCTNLEVLDFSNNNFQTIDLSKNKELRYIIIHNNRLPKLDVTNNPKLMNVNCSNNRLNSIDLSKNSIDRTRQVWAYGSFHLPGTSHGFSWAPNGRTIKAECALLPKVVNGEYVLDENGCVVYESLYYLRLDDNVNTDERSLLGRMLETDESDFDITKVDESSWTGGTVFTGTRAKRILGANNLKEKDVIGKILVLNPAAGSEESGTASGRVTYRYVTGHNTPEHWANYAAANNIDLSSPEGQQAMAWIDDSPTAEAVSCYINWTAEVGVITAVEDLYEDRPLKEKEVDCIKYFNLSGHSSNRPFSGLNIVVIYYKDGSTSASKVFK